MATYSIPLTRWYYQGQVAAAAKVHVYETNSTTPVTIYNDGALSSPAANPVTCDSSGAAAFYAGAGTALRVYVTTSGGAVIADLDPVYPFPDLTGAALSLSTHGQCRLTKSGADLLLSQFNGNRLVINRVAQTIPAAGVTLSASALSANTAYFVYAYMSGTTMVLEASAAGHITDPTTGVETKAGDDTRTLVGMARTVTGPAWADTPSRRLVISWFNRRPIYLTSAFTANRTRSTASFAELNAEIRNEFLTWEDAAVNLSAGGAVQVGTSGQGYQSAIGIDGATPEDCYCNGSAAGANQGLPLAINHATTLSEGYHYATLLGYADAGGATWYGNSSGSLRCTLKSVIQG